MSFSFEISVTPVATMAYNKLCSRTCFAGCYIVVISLLFIDLRGREPDALYT
jgi:hypothetical protein